MRILILFLLLLPVISLAQQDVYVDAQGVMRWQKDNKAAYFFGVNYTTPFAYGYRSVLRSGITVEKAIDDDVYHFARMGLNAFRVHVWDTEISDAKGNLLSNEHLRLFDYLLSALEKRGIRIMLTPLAFWGNGYPEKDSMTRSFSSLYNKQKVLVEELAIEAQENYLKQLITHINPYTKKRYKDDRYIIGLEINNEPHHSGSLEMASGYISRMIRSVKDAGWGKPVFYNISESPLYAKPVAESGVQGVSFQWYPTGLVSNHTLEGNFLPSVDEYTIPFDTIAAFKNKARIVYEFDAADILSPVMYPAMARSFRKAGFQWATQFAYDPMATAGGNTEYQTHYLNLAYTPQKAISMMIAARVFMEDSGKADYGNYPADTLFGNATVHPTEKRSEWNADETFYYTGSTATVPVNINALQHIAGTGNSAVVKYSGNGAYFLDKLSQGVWRLECMPDVLELADPFGRATAGRIVRRVVWNEQTMSVDLTDLGNDFLVNAVNKGNTSVIKANGRSIIVKPGVYIIRSKGKAMPKKDTFLNVIRLDEFVAPAPVVRETDDPLVTEKPDNARQTGVLFTPAESRNRLMIINPEWNKYIISYPSGDTVLQLKISDSIKGRMFAWQLYIGDYRKNGKNPDTLQIRISSGRPLSFRIGLVDIYGTSFLKQCLSDSTGLVSVPLSSLTAGPSLLLPRPYPGFQPLWFKHLENNEFRISDMDKLEFIYTSDGNPGIISIGRISLH